MQKTYALFDFDGTLRKGDSIVAVCRHARRLGLCSSWGLWKGALAALAYGVRLFSPERAKETAMSWLKGRTAAEMAAFSQDFCLNVLLPQLYPQGVEAIQAEERRGAEVLLITASPAFYLQPLVELLGLRGIIGTRMALDESERYTGELFGENCRGVQKPLRLAEYLAAQGDRLDYETSTAYGDSRSDQCMLDLCGSKVLVNPKRSLLRALGGQPGVRIVAWGPERAAD